MEFCSGGELFTLIKSMNGFNDRQGRFYAACVTEALNYLHSKRIIFRDLKVRKTCHPKQDKPTSPTALNDYIVSCFLGFIAGERCH